jgi:hypothetical protein
LLSERNPEPNQHTVTRALPPSGLIRPTADRSKARRYLEGGCRALAMGLEPQPNRTPSDPPVEPCIDPLYLFACGLSWRKHSNTTAGWELVRSLRSSGQTARIAAALLAQAENIRPVQARAHAIDAPAKTSLRPEAGLPRSARGWL